MRSQTKRIGPQCERHPCSPHAHLAVALFDAEAGRGAVEIGGDGESRLLVEAPAAADLDAQQVIAQHVDAQLLAVQLGRNAAIRPREAAHALETCKIAGIDRAWIRRATRGRCHDVSGSSIREFADGSISGNCTLTTR